MVTIKGDRSLYVYLLDYGWPEGEWERLFKKHFMHMADRASQTGAVVIGSNRGLHFANEVLSYHAVGNLDSEKALPGLLITKTHPSYFKESTAEHGEPAPGMKDLLVVPLKPFCKDETDFLRAIEGIFTDLRNGTELKNFQIAKHDGRQPMTQNLGKRIVKAIAVKPGAFGVSVDLKELLLPGK